MNYNNDMKGVLFNAEKKSEKHPDYTGNVVINGVEYRLAAWKRTSKKGQNYISLSVSSGGYSNSSSEKLLGDNVPF